MSTTEYLSFAAAVVAIGVAIAGAVKDRRKPVLDAAQAESAIVNSDSVKQQIKRMSDESNMRRDLRILDLEQWGDRVRPYLRIVAQRFDELCDLIREDREKLDLPMPNIEPLPPAPEMPPPRPL